MPSLDVFAKGRDIRTLLLSLRVAVLTDDLKRPDGLFGANAPLRFRVAEDVIHFAASRALASAVTVPPRAS